MKAADLRKIVGEPVDVAVETGPMTVEQRRGSDVRCGALKARVLAVGQHRVVPSQGSTVGVGHAFNGVQVRFAEPFHSGSTLYSRNAGSDGTFVIDPGRILDTWDGYQQRLAEQQERRDQAAADLARAQREHETLLVRASKLATELGGTVSNARDGTPQVSFTVDQAQQLADQAKDQAP